MPAQEFFPGGPPPPLRRRFDPVVLQDIRDGAATDRVPQIGQRPKNPPIAPIPVFRCQAHHQALDLTESAGATGTPFLAAIVFLSDQPPMPSQKHFWRNDGRDFPKNASPEPLRLGRQTSTLIVVQPEAPVAQLLSEYSVFLPQVIDRVPLLLTQPAGDRNHQQPERIEGRAHCDSIPLSAL